MFNSIYKYDNFKTLMLHIENTLLFWFVVNYKNIICTYLLPTSVFGFISVCV